MKNYVIGLLLVTIILLGSFLYNINQHNIYHGFQNEKIYNKGDIENPFYLFFFFSYKNCSPCLEVIYVLNNLPPPFVVIGVVRPEELRDEPFLRNEFGITFRIISTSKLKKYIPPYWPTIIGVDQNKKIYFILPSVPDEEKYLEEFLTTFYERAYPVLYK
jgi:hypothetical protein